MTVKEYNQERVGRATHQVRNAAQAVVFVGSELDCICKGRNACALGETEVHR